MFKSEALHAERLWPFLTLADIDDDRLAALFARAASHLHANIADSGKTRSTTPHGGHFVYERWRKPCRRCMTPILRSYRGTQGRSTYWCPRCQPEP